MTGPGDTVSAAAAIETRGLARRFGTVEALRDVTLRVDRGEIYGLVGPDGAGKTTTIRTLAGLLSRTAGTVSILGMDPVRDGPKVRERMGMMPQRYSLYADLSIEENLTFFGRLFCLPRSVYRARAERLLSITQLTPFVARRASALSGGMYKKLALACALLHEPSVLLLDEPTNGVDPVSRRDLWELLHTFSGSGMAVLVSTPSMDEAERCHRVGLLHEGRMLTEGTPHDLLAAFADDVFELEGGDLLAIEQEIPTMHGVMASSFASTKPRIVVRRDASPSVVARIEALGSVARRSTPTFEEAFLARLEER